MKALFLELVGKNVDVKLTGHGDSVTGTVVEANETYATLTSAQHFGRGPIVHHHNTHVFYQAIASVKYFTHKTGD